MALASRLVLLWLVLTACDVLTAQRTPDAALQALQDGNRRFAADRSVAQPLGEGVRRTLARGQSPFAIVLCCADSRVPPEHIFNAGLGELFVVRVAGHAADAETIASIEYAVEHLNTPLCVVLGHEGCGAIAASVRQAQQHRGDGLSPAMQHLLEHMEPAVQKASAKSLGGKDLLDACEEEHAHATLHQCLRRSALLQRYATVGKFRMVAARYRLDSGTIEWLPNRPLPTEPRPDEHAPHSAVPAGVPPHVALRLLQAGHRRFLGEGRPSADLTAARREALTHGQQPLAIVVTCADSRVAPEHVFDAGLGELFVIRIAGNTINDDALASIEYAAAHTGASLLVVMGHTKCGALQAASEHPPGQELSPNLRALLLRLEPSVAAAKNLGGGRDLVDLAVRVNAQRAVEEARSRSQLLRQLEAEGRFTMLASVYDIASGDLHWLKDAAVPTTAAAGEGKAARDRHEVGGSHRVQKHAAAGQAANESTPAQHAGGHGLASHELPVLDWAQHGAPAGESKAPATVGHADPVHATDPHAATDVPGHAGANAHGPGTATHAPHADPHGHSAPEGATPPPGSARSARWTDPVILIGISGVVSLLAAAILALKRR